MAHKHIAVKTKNEVRGWTHCVTPSECAARPQRQVAHGNIIEYDVCSCGATRASEINGGRTNYGPWSAIREEEGYDD